MLQISLAEELRHQPWYLDSRCPQHMTRRSYMFQSLELKPKGIVGFRGDQKGNTISFGTVGSSTLPSITIILLSDNGYDIIFNQKSCKVVIKQDGSVLFKGKKKKNI